VSLRLAGVGAFIASVGDLAMLWVANASRLELALPTPPEATLWIGCTLGVAGIPLYALGYRAAAQAIASDLVLARRIVRWAGGGAAVVGAYIHGLTALLIADALARGAPGADPFASVTSSGVELVGLWSLASLLVLAASLAFALQVARDRSALPRWVAWTNPAFGTLVVALTGLALSEPVRSFLAPAAPNLAHALFFAAASLTSSANASFKSSIMSQRSGTRSRQAIKPKSR
jgi:hypothetical protein